MFQIFKDIISYSGQSNIDSTIIQGCIVVLVLSVVLCFDFLLKILLGLMPRKDK